MTDLPPEYETPLLSPTPDPGAYDLRKSSRSTLPIFLGVGILAAGGIGYGLFRAAQTRETRKLHASFMEAFAGVEKDDVGAFWNCVLGPNTDPGMFADNLQFGQRLDATFAQDPLHYPDKVIDDCIPKLKGIGTKALNLPAEVKADRLTAYNEPLEKYAKSLDSLAAGMNDWASKAKSRSGDRDIEKKLQAAGTSFHAVDGKPSVDALAYEKVLRCVFPQLDTIKETQEILQLLFESCKKLEFVARLHGECGQLVNQKANLVEDKTFKASLARFGADDRDMQALDDCFRKSRKGKKGEDSTSVGQAWVEYMTERSAVRKVGADALKDD